MTIAVTGADGFIGSHVAETLARQGASVRAMCVYNSNGSLGWLDSLEADVSAGIDARLGDVRDADFVAAFVKGADVVLHLAALIAIPYSYEAPRSYIETNVIGTTNVLEAVRRHDVPRMVNTSTSEVYGTPRTVPITESHALQAQSPYSATKIAADKLCEAWAASFQTPVVTLRPFNTYGPRQSRRAVIPTILAQLLAGATELRLGSLTPKRDFTFVSDTVAGFLAVATAQIPLDGSAIQLGTGDTVTIGELVRLAQSITGKDAEVVVDDARVRPDASEVLILQSDPSRARDLLGWRPTVSLEDGLRATAQWLAGTPLDRDLAARYAR
jgi:UDP-glucose 4-epimerase